MNKVLSSGISESKVKMSIERQVRIASGFLVLIGIALAYCCHPYFILFSIVVALGMVLSGITDSCALGALLSRLPWNRRQ